MRNLSLKAAGALGVIVAVVMVPMTAAFASGSEIYTSTEAVTGTTGFIGQLSSPLATIMLAIAGGIVGIAVLGWGLRTVFNKVRSAAHF